MKNYLSAWTVHHVDDGSGCGDTCDQEAQLGWDTCFPQHANDPDPEEFMACWVTFLDSDCHDCLCEAIYDSLGLSCPAVAQGTIYNLYKYSKKYKKISFSLDCPP